MNLTPRTHWQDVRSNSTFRIPIIDFSAFHANTALSEKRRVVDGVVNGFNKAGFDQVAWEEPRANRGYVKVGRERVTHWDPLWKSKWLNEADSPGFKQTMLQFFQVELHVAMMRSVALGLDLHESFFDQKIDQQRHNFRLLLYPPIRTKLLEGQARADYGTITLLFQDSVGGLEVQNPHTQQFQPAAPIPGTIVVNAEDLLAPQKISDTEGLTPSRQSIAFFCSPNSDVVIEALPTCVSATNTGL
ncbi:Clavaminate synthase-like protein [Imleria badia]|nr:Clavaminate synthase-like protein [Imleria badia]